MWAAFVGLFYAFFFTTCGLYWGDLQPREAPYVPWLIAGMMGSSLIAVIFGCIANRKDALNWRKRK